MKYGYQFKGCDQDFKSEVPPNGNVKPTLKDILRLAVGKIPTDILEDEIKKRVRPSTITAEQDLQMNELYNYLEPENDQT